MPKPLIITCLSLGLLLSVSSLNAAGIEWEEIDISTPPLPMAEVTEQAPTSISKITTQAMAQLKLFRTQSTISQMSTKERKELVKRLDSTRSIELESTIPTEQKIKVESAESGCFLFWKSCFKVASKTLGSLALDLIMDISDGKLDGKGPNGSIDYMQHVVNIVDASITEAKTIVNR